MVENNTPTQPKNVLLSYNGVDVILNHNIIYIIQYNYHAFGFAISEYGYTNEITILFRS